jgi:hypothetical protein
MQPVVACGLLLLCPDKNRISHPRSSHSFSFTSSGFGSARNSVSAPGNFSRNCLSASMAGFIALAKLLRTLDIQGRPLAALEEGAASRRVRLSQCPEVQTKFLNPRSHYKMNPRQIPHIVINIPLNCLGNILPRSRHI